MHLTTIENCDILIVGGGNLNITFDSNIILGRKFDTYDLVVISFEFSDYDFYYIAKDRIGESDIITTSLPDLDDYKCIFTTNLTNLRDKDKINFIKLILKKIIE